MESLPAWHTGRALLSREVNAMVVTVEQMKRLEKKTVELGSSYLQLMEQAGSAATNLLVERYFLIGKQVVILTGSGNNGETDTSWPESCSSEGPR